ncbi:hypothetical protein D3C81_1902340 [compost metagenome]
MKITGTSNRFRMSLTASMPDEPSASWISAKTRPGRCRVTASTASSCVVAVPVTLWPSSRTRLSISAEMMASSSMIRTSVASSASMSV